MGVDAGRLLPQARLDDIAVVLEAGDADGAREAVRRLAPAATRRIARRLFTDDELKRRSEVYVRRYKTLIADAGERGDTGDLLREMLSDDAGRIFLLLDAAVGETL